MSAHHPPFPPRPPFVDPRELRPRRFWYVCGAGVIVLGVLAGIAVFAALVIGALELPEFRGRVEGSGEAVFAVDGESFERIGLYSGPAGADRDACALVLPDGGEQEFGGPSVSHSVETGNTSWSLVGDAPRSADGEYTLVCDGEPGTVYAVGSVGGGAGFMAGVAGALAAFVGLPLAGFAIGLPILVVTGVRRHRHHRRLLGERSRPPHRP